MFFLIPLIRTLSTAITILVIAHVVLSYFMSPYHPIREVIDRVVNPLLYPIRRIMPQTGMLDFSPFVLIILVRVLEGILVRLILSL